VLISGLLVLSILGSSCVPIGSAPGITEDGRTRFQDGVVQVKDESGNWVPVAGTSTFELVGALDGTDPWIVAGRTLKTNELTQSEQGLQTGDLVRVRGAIVDNDTWVAYSIALAGEQDEPVMILIGIVDSIDPWVVNGIELTVTEETDIADGITPGTIVRVEILLLPDGTWQVLSIDPLGDVLETPGCVTVIATVLSVDGDQIQFEGWPTPVTLAEGTPTENNEDENSDGSNENSNEDNDSEETIQPGQTVLAVACIDEDGRLVIVQIILLSEDDDAGDGSGNGEKVLVCHNASKNNPHTISIAQPAVPAHLAHGDTLGPCP
jgi:hypothetical protein